MAKKAKKLTDQQKVDIYYSVDNEGLAQSITEGYLDDNVKGTALAPLVKAAQKAIKAVESKLEKLGIGFDGYENVKALEEKIENQQNNNEESSADQS